MKAEEYCAILSRLPIKNPTPKDMAMVCPHLTEKEAVKAFNTRNGYVACPPLRIRDGYQVLSYHREWVEEIKVWRNDTQVVVGTKNHPARLDHAFGHRTRKSYADGKKHGDVFFKNVGMYKAMKFAEENWPESLIVDDWVDVVTMYIQDPTDLVNDKYHSDYPRTKKVLYVTLNRPLNEIINDHSKPESELFDLAVNQMTTDQLIECELRGGRGGYTRYNCANCGHGLNTNRCEGCGYRFNDDLFRCGNGTPLSRKMVEFLRLSGHKFRVDPEIAWKKEQEEFEQHLEAAEKWRKERKDRNKFR